MPNLQDAEEDAGTFVRATSLSSRKSSFGEASRAGATLREVMDGGDSPDAPAPAPGKVEAPVGALSSGVGAVQKFPRSLLVSQ